MRSQLEDTKNELADLTNERFGLETSMDRRWTKELKEKHDKNAQKILEKRGQIRQQERELKRLDKEVKALEEIVADK